MASAAFMRWPPHLVEAVGLMELGIQQGALQLIQVRCHTMVLL